MKQKLYLTYAFLYIMMVNLSFQLMRLRISWEIGLWEVVIVRLIELGRPAYCRGTILHDIKRESEAVSPSWCGCDVSGYFKFLLS